MFSLFLFSGCEAIIPRALFPSFLGGLDFRAIAILIILHSVGLGGGSGSGSGLFSTGVWVKWGITAFDILFVCFKSR